MQQSIEQEKNPELISMADFTYDLPPGRIASFPLSERDGSKLLIYRQNSIAEDVYGNIATHIPADSLLVFNDTRVVEARIMFKKPTGAMIEIFCLEPHEQYGDITSAMLQQKKVWWKCLIGGVSKWKPGQLLEKQIFFAGKTFLVDARYIEKQHDCFIVELSWSPPEMSFAEMLHIAGNIPLPPYIKRKTESMDAERYQTIYASHDGSVAAPTAGLHFTDAIFERLRRKNIATTFVTLHIGAGTFKPVKSEILAQHEMHAEWIEVSAQLVETLLKNIGSNIIPVGTTSLRTLESLYWLGAKTILFPGIALTDLVIHQWDAYQLPVASIAAADALTSLLQWMKNNQLDTLITKTQLLIVPGYTFNIIKALITNFHQPASTLILLVAALTGASWKEIYQYALDNDFRFLSYGDGCLLFR